MPTSELVDEVSALFASLITRADSHVDLKVRVKLYVQDLADIDGATLKDAIRRFRKGELGDGKWLPTAGEIRQAIAAEAAAIAAKRAEAEERLRKAEQRQRDLDEQFAARHKAADRDSLEARQRASKVAEQLIEELKLKQTIQPQKSRLPTEDEAESMLVRYEAGERPKPVTTFSEKLLAQFRGEIPIGSGALGARPLATTHAGNSEVAITEPRKAI